MKYDLIDLENFGKAASKAYLEHKIPLNDSITKLAEINNLTSEQVKLVVEEANNTTHLSLLAKAEDKYIEFPVADFKKVATRVFENTPEVDKLADYRKSPNAKLEKFDPQYDEIILESQTHSRNANPDDMSTAEIYKFAQKYNGIVDQYDSILGQHKWAFDELTENYYKEVKQAVLGGEKLAHVRQAAIMSATDPTNMGALNEFFQEVQGRLKKAGIDMYPYSADLNLDTESVHLGTPNSEHTLVKLAEEFCSKVDNYKLALDKKAGIAAAAAILAAGAVTGAAGTATVMSAVQKKKDLKKAIKNNPLTQKDLGYNAAIRRY